MTHELVGSRIEAGDGNLYDVVNFRSGQGFQVRDMAGRREWVPNLGPHRVVGDTLAQAQAAQAQAAQEASASAPGANPVPPPTGLDTRVVDLLQRIEMNTDRTVELLEAIEGALDPSAKRTLGPVRIPAQAPEDPLLD